MYSEFAQVTVTGRVGAATACIASPPTPTMEPAWVRELLGTILQVPIDEETTVDAAERLLAEKVRVPSATSKLSPMRYLYGCLTRGDTELGRPGATPEKQALIRRTQAMVCNYMALCVTDQALVPYYNAGRPVPPAAVEFLFIVVRRALALPASWVRRPVRVL